MDGHGRGLEDLDAPDEWGQPRAAPAIAGVYLHLHEVWRRRWSPPMTTGVLVGWLAFWGDSPRYLPAGDVARCQDPEAWLDEGHWRQVVPGSPDMYALRHVARIAVDG